MQLGFKQAIEGRRDRTRFLVDRLKEVQDSRNQAIVRNQAAFSIFCLADDPLYWDAGTYPEDYKDLLMQERDILSELLKEEQIRLKLILWPVPAYESPYVRFRCETLIRWMREMQGNDLVEYAAAENRGTNRYIFQNDFCLEGINTRRSGYRITLVHYDSRRVGREVENFDRLMNQAGGDKADAIAKIEQRTRAILQNRGESIDVAS